SNSVAQTIRRTKAHEAQTLKVLKNQDLGIEFQNEGLVSFRVHDILVASFISRREIRLRKSNVWAKCRLIQAMAMVWSSSSVMCWEPFRLRTKGRCGVPVAAEYPAI